jgi:photosystem II stability/assembly factor-like uncharacterized protein
MKPKILHYFFHLLSALLMILVSTGINSQPQYYNLTGGTLNNAFPFNTLPATGKTTQTLYLPGDFNQPVSAPSGNITKIYFQAVSAGVTTYNQLTIKMGLTTDTDLPAAGWYTGPLTTVLNESNYVITTATDQFVAIILTTPFSYDASKSLVVEITQCGYSGSGFGVRNTTTSGIKRNAGPLTGTSCPHPYGNQGAIMTHTGIDVIPTLNCNYTWNTQTSGITSLIYSVKSVSSSIAWAAGAGAVVRKTTDGGSTWSNANPNPGVITGDIYNIEALDANTAWVTTSAASTFIYKTTNGGTNWTQVFTLAGGFTNTIKMVSPTVGYAFGDPVSLVWMILKTTDGGTTWVQMPSAPASVAGEDGRNNCLQILGSDMWFGTGQNKVYHSTNSGLNWTNAVVTGITGQVTGIQFNTPLVGIAGGSTMSKTTDGGTTWTLLAASGTGTISGIKGSGNDYWYVRGTQIYRSTDLGGSWNLSHTQSAAQNDISIIPDGAGCMTGWSAGTTGTISKMTGIPVSVNDPVSNIPSAYKLWQNYPNPFNPVTGITYALPLSGNVELKVYDVLGKEVAEIVNSYMTAGVHNISFDASSLASGVYIYKLTSGSFTESKKMVLIK